MSVRFWKKIQTLLWRSDNSLNVELGGVRINAGAK